ncbi:Neuroligin-2 [Camponotus floridanus]|uniref:Neuroligin-2 n=1 Tax=Camponotus floridanus TaxID=104421 RepID=E2ATH2_CAMFO|nr:Neuroligin-2 [Camponotus floridanus]
MIELADKLALTTTTTTVSKSRLILSGISDLSPAARAIKADQKMGSVHGEELPFVFGAPLWVEGFGHFPKNYTRLEMALSESIMQYFANFVKTGTTMDFFIPIDSSHYFVHKIIKCIVYEIFDRSGTFGTPCIIDIAKRGTVDSVLA